MNGDTGFDVLKYHVSKGHSIARIDIALDFINCDLQVEDFAHAWRLKQCDTRLRSCNEVKSLDDDGHTLYIGSQKTRKKLIRIYNKAVEQGLDADWIRVELQLMGKPATALSKLWIDASGDDMFLLKGIKDVVNFPTIHQWSKVFQGKEAIRIGTQTDEKGDTRDWLLNQVIPSLSREIILDADFWVQFKLMTDTEVERLQG